MKKFFIGILIVVMVSTFSSCMMMMPGHMAGTMQGDHNHEHSNGKIDPVCGKQVISVWQFLKMILATLYKNKRMKTIKKLGQRQA
ncbi:MAG: hypothetical protein NTZ69_03810 [Bacteroidia bacterium]|nr:hypothetical protein [Bacteroidia bacterium]